MKRKPFNAGDPYERVADRVRVEIANLGLRLMDDPDYRALSPVQQIETFLAGGITGLIGVCFASVRPDGRDKMMEAVEAYLPWAREQAEAIQDGAMRQSKS